MKDKKGLGIISILLFGIFLFSSQISANTEILILNDSISIDCNSLLNESSFLHLEKGNESFDISIKKLCGKDDSNLSYKCFFIIDKLNHVIKEKNKEINDLRWLWVAVGIEAVWIIVLLIDGWVIRRKKSDK